MNPTRWKRLSMDEERRFLRAYLETRAKLSNNNQPVTDEHVERLFGQVMLVKPVSTCTGILLDRVVNLSNISTYITDK